MSFFRSEPMRFYKLILYKETAFDCLVELGYQGLLEFNNVTMRDPITSELYGRKVERCANLQLIISRFQDELNQLGIKTFYYPNVDQDHEPHVNDLREIEEIMLKLNDELKAVIHRCMDLRKLWISLLERQEVLLRTDNFLTGALNTEAQITTYDALLLNFLQNTTTGKVKEQSPEAGLALCFIAGTIPMQLFATFELMVWRVSHGNCYIKRKSFELPEFIVGTHGINRFKYIFILTFVGDKLQAKLNKVCQGFGIKIYACPVLATDRREAMKTNAAELNDIEKVYMQTLEHKQRILAAPSMELFIWRSKIRKIKAIYLVLSRLHTIKELNDGKNKYIEAECWIPKSYAHLVRKALVRGARRCVDGDTKQVVFLPILNELRDHHHAPPTFFPTNKFTQVFQNLVDAYGIATYQEINPAPFFIVTFPFLFSVMFSDMGHGLILTLIALGFIGNEKKYIKHQRDRTEPHDVIDLLFAARYMILLMGVFSMYTGFIFNNVFSKTLNIFGSNWRVNFTYSDVQTHEFLQLDPARLDHFLGNPYLFGFDPIWGNTLSKNWITINNSLKMKASIVLGVAHMMFGLFLSAANALHFKDKTELYLKFLPQVILMCSTFLYLVVLIFQKWFCYGGHEIQKFSPGCAPSLFYTFLNMLLFKKPSRAPEGCSNYIYGAQPIVQTFLVVVAIICILILFCGHPIRHYFLHRRFRFKRPRFVIPSRSGIRKMRKTLIALDIQRISSSELLGKSKLSDVSIKHFISTIECVMGSISHTASYLRLWALSLAHGELTYLVWNMLFPIAFRSNRGYLNSMVLFGSFAAFAILTIIFLVVMEGLAAFMHTLRLHWFEFQSKFYKGDGHAFTPFRFEPSKRIDEKT